MFLLALIWVLIGVAVGWRFGSRRATSQVLTRARQQMRQEIRYWQEQAERSKVRADLLAQENEAWAAGYRQGREEVITIGTSRHSSGSCPRTPRPMPPGSPAAPDPSALPSGSVARPEGSAGMRGHPRS